MDAYYGNEVLGGRYWRYKEGTKFITEWLLDTAHRHTDITKIISSLKNRKPPRKSALYEVKLNTDEYKDLAYAILGTKKALQPVPGSVFTILGKIIEDRDEQALVSAQEDLNPESDRKHKHFNDVLKDVQKTLRSVQHNYDSSTSKKAAGAEMGNLFNNLTLEETTGLDTFDTDTAKASSKKKEASPKWNIKIESDHEPPDYALWCHLEDLYDIRMSVMDTWNDYLKGDVTFMRACMTTQVACALIQSSSQRFCALEEEFNSLQKMYDFLHLVTRVIMGQKTCFIARKDPSIMPSTRGQQTKIAELLCVVGSRVGGFCLTQLGGLPDYGRDDDFEKDNPPGPSRPRHPVSYLALSEAMLEHTLAILRYTHRSNCPDVVFEGIRKFRETAEIPLWLAVALQIYADIFELLGPDGSKAGLDLVNKTLADNRNNFKRFRTEYLGVSGRLTSQSAGRLKQMIEAETLLGRGQQILQQERKAFDCGDTDDSAYEGQAENYKKLAKDNPYIDGLERKFPIQAALATQFIQSDLLSVVILRAIDDTAVLHSAVYLYKILCESKLLSGQWEDMDEFIAAQTSSFLPNQATPRNLLEYFQKAIGFSPPKQKGVAIKLETNVKDGGKPLQHPQSFSQRLYKKTQGKKNEEAKKNPSRTIEQILHEMAKENGQEARTAMGLLKFFKQTYTKDEQLFSFNYYGFALACAQLMEQFAERLLEIDDYDRANFKRHSFSMVWTILNKSATAQSLQKVMERHVPDEAVKAIEDYIKINGSQFSTTGSDRSDAGVPTPSPPERSDICLKREQDMKTKIASIEDVPQLSFQVCGPLTVLYHPCLITDHLATGRFVINYAGVDIPIKLKEFIDQNC